MVETAAEVAAAGPDPRRRGLEARILDFVGALRRAGVPVAVSDDLDALRAAGIVDLLDRDQLREGFAATLIKSAGHRPAFDTLFDVYFPRRTDRLPGEADEDPENGAAQPDEPRDVGDFLAELVEVIRTADDAALRRLAQEAVEAFGAVPGPDGATQYFGYRIWRSINLQGVLRRLLGEAGVGDDTLPDRLARDEFEERLRRFREAVDAELRRRLAARRGEEEVARTAVRSLPEDVDFFAISHDEQTEMRRAVRPLARRLATRLALRRRNRKDGRLDMRRTIRESLSTGGVPLQPYYRARRQSRPDLMLLCDVSGSVAAFSRFTLLFCHALTGQFSRVRSFAFIDTVDEVTGLFEQGDASEAIARINTEADLVWLDGHSDYGHALETFHARFADEVNPRTTVLVLGDARNNYRAANTWVLRDLRRRGKAVYWLNPEPVRHWGSGDSIATSYATAVDQMAECRNLRQLAEFVETLG